MSQKRALITGIFGQDGAYLAQLLLERGYEVIGTHRRTATTNSWRLKELGLEDKIKFFELELLEHSNIIGTLRDVAPNEIYNLAAQSFVGSSFSQPVFTGDANALGVTRILEAIRIIDPDIRFYQASTSEMFGKVQETPQNEDTPFYPRSPYGVAKLYGHWITKNYREAYGLHAASGILFNHESPFRGPEFVTRKITMGLARLQQGDGEPVELGNLSASRDWGHARDYVRAMHLMLTSDEADDYVIATGQTHSVEEFANIAAECAGFNLEWNGEDEARQATDRKSGRLIIRVNPEFYRPAEVDFLLGDSSKAKTKLGWQPKISFEELVSEMVAFDVDLVRTWSN